MNCQEIAIFCVKSLNRPAQDLFFYWTFGTYAVGRGGEGGGGPNGRIWPGFLLSVLVDVGNWGPSSWMPRGPLSLGVGVGYLF